MMWIRDHPIHVHQTPAGLGFRRAEFEGILEKLETLKSDDS